MYLKNILRICIRFLQICILLQLFDDYEVRHNVICITSYDKSIDAWCVKISDGSCTILSVLLENGEKYKLNLMYIAML